MPDLLGSPIAQAQDGENNPVRFDFAYTLRGNLAGTLRQLRARHGEEIFLLPMSGTSSGGGIFQSADKPGRSVIGLRFDPPPEPRPGKPGNFDLCRMAPDTILFDPERQRVYAGAGVTLGQMSQTLAAQLGAQFRVPGADLTSYQYAAVGATFMTGGMGPQRRYFSDSVVEAAIFDGRDIVAVEGPALAGHAGTYGWSGIVSALCCRYHRFPPNEIAFALPVSGDPQSLARLLDHLAPWCYLQMESDPVCSSAAAGDLILGLEHVSRASMQPLLAASAGSSAARRARKLQQACDAGGADGIIFVNGLSDDSVEDFLPRLLDDDGSAIAGTSIEHAEIFHQPEEMRDLREAIPYAARTQTPKHTLVYKNHTDANIRIPEAHVETTMSRLWQIACDYVSSVDSFFTRSDEIDGEILVYGHLNPFGVDPHNRVTMSCADRALFEQGREYLLEQRARYFRSLAALCSDSDASFVGGEKAADSERGIFAALGGPQNAPAELYARFRRQQETIRHAAPLFNWRALEPYR